MQDPWRDHSISFRKFGVSLLGTMVPARTDSEDMLLSGCPHTSIAIAYVSSRSMQRTSRLVHLVVLGPVLAILFIRTFTVFLFLVR